MSIKVIRDFLAVSVVKEAETTAGGIIIPGTNGTDKMVRGTVVAVGSGQLSSSGASVPLEVKVGDQIFFNKTLAIEVKSGDDKLWVLREENVVAVLN